MYCDLRRCNLISQPFLVCSADLDRMSSRSFSHHVILLKFYDHVQNIHPVGLKNLRAPRKHPRLCAVVREVKLHDDVKLQKRICTT